MASEKYLLNKRNQIYLNNPSLKAVGVSIEYTPQMASEYGKCSSDPIYYIENYAMINSLDRGPVLMKLYPYQKRIILSIHNNRKVIAKLFRQAGKSSVVAAYISWYIQFCPSKRVAILANKASIAKEIFSRVQFIIELTPKWLQQGVKEWNKTSLELENLSGCFAAASSPSSIRGKSINFLLCVGGDTKVTLRNKENLRKITVPIKELEGMISIPKLGVYNPENVWEVLTDQGFSDFSSLKISEAQEFVNLKFSNGTDIKVTLDHRILTQSGWVAAQSIKPNQYCVSTNKNLVKVVSVSKISGEKAYDLVGVVKNSRYYTNDILSHNCDEFAHLSNNLGEEFIASVFPTISASQTSKLVLVSTPKGRNNFFKIWSDAEQNKNGFVICDGHWSEHPERNQKWADEQRATLGEVRYQQEIETSFIGSDYNLISGSKLSTLTTKEPIFQKDCLSVWEHPQVGHTYVCTVDTAEGVHMDYSAFVMFDITKMPYRVVATYKNNDISPMSYPYLISQVCQKYNNAYALVETNSMGGEVANTLLYDLEYENVYYTNRGSLTENTGYPGLKTTKKVKAVGTSTLKELIEQDQLEISSFEILAELSVFSKKGTSYQSTDPNGVNDDLTSCLWIFAFLTKQQIFSDLTSTNVRSILAQKAEEYMLEQMMPFGIISTGLEKDSSGMEDIDVSKFSRGDSWIFRDMPDGAEED